MTATEQKRTFVVGTAGHVDHGKSTLVKVLTGVDPDRLAEEKARGMTIDLGFASLHTPAGRDVSIVDVPGHERFIKNMLAGVGGIDAALLVVAADEGPMPQTREHLAILDLLGVQAGIVVLTKRDLVDVEWLDMVEEETRESIAGTLLAGAPIVGVSARSGEGLDALRDELDRVLADCPPHSHGAIPRLPIDRVFSLSGFGTVVTGTLLGGELHVGQELRVFPGGASTRVRGLQSHAQRLEHVGPGTRVAVNVTGLAVERLQRGDVLTVPGGLAPSLRLDVELRLLSDSPVSLEQNSAVDLFVGSAERRAWVTLLDRERLAPGDSGWVQLRLREPVAVLKGDRFIIRRPSPSDTIGGGAIVDPSASPHKRFRPEVVNALATLATGTPEAIVLQALEARARTMQELTTELAASLPEPAVREAVHRLLDAGEILRLAASEADAAHPNDHLVVSGAFRRMTSSLVDALEQFHAANPIRIGMSKEELRRRLGLGADSRLFDRLLDAAARANIVVVERTTVRRPDFRVRLDAARRQAADRFLAAIRSSPFAPPTPEELGIDADTLSALGELGEVVRVSDDVVYDAGTFAEIESAVIRIIERDGTITIASYRDHFGTSRKYAQATLEYLDQRKITRRIGDARVRFAGVGAARAAGVAE